MDTVQAAYLIPSLQSPLFPPPSAFSSHQQTLEILVEDIVTIDAIGIHRYLVDTIDVVDAHRDSVNI